jgi:EAL domain-containing protein (putative c-di-GMP-specific phosphodiesterase class I)
VEEESHVNFLESLGCDEIQGYWFSKPVESAELVNFLAEKGGDIKVEPRAYSPSI